MNHPFHGCGTALVTPFTSSRTLDEAAYRRLLRFQIEAGIDFLVPCGTTGETPTLTRQEHLRLIAIAVEEAHANGRKVPVLGGAGGNNTAAVTELARAVEAEGVDGILTVVPYYNKPSQEGVFQHFAAVAAAVKLPLVLYNVPGRTGGNMEAATVLRLAALGSVVAVKEASGNLAQIGAILQGAPTGFSVLSGDDALTLPLIAMGARGLISVASNEIPGPMTELVRTAMEGDFTAARELHYRYLALMDVNFIESSPGPVKAALARMGLCEEIYRLPMAPIGESGRRRLEAVLQSLQLMPTHGTQSAQG